MFNLGLFFSSHMNDKLFSELEHLRKMQTDLAMAHMQLFSDESENGNTNSSPKTPKPADPIERTKHINRELKAREDKVQQIVKQLDELVDLLKIGFKPDSNE